MDNKVQKLNLEYYLNYYDNLIEKQDYIGGLNVLYSALKFNNYKVFQKLAEAYSYISAYELSNEFWYKYLLKAPNSKIGIGYEGLAINFFYLDDFDACAYYLHQKVEKDGVLEDARIDEEIISALNAHEINDYYLAYPFNKADYSSVNKKAKRALAFGDYKLADSYYDKIPEECYTKQTYSEKIITSFLTCNDDKVAELCKKSIDRFGENVSAYCNLSTLYTERKNEDKAIYYYNKALACQTGDSDEPYSLVACAIQRGDHRTVNLCVEKILKDRPNDFLMIYYYALSFINIGDYIKGRKYLEKARKLNPYNFYIKYYLNFINLLEKGEKSAEKLLPLYYGNAFGEKLQKKYSSILNKLSSTAVKKGTLNAENVKDALEWALFSNKATEVKQALFILSVLSPKKLFKIIQEKLISTFIDDEIKIILIYSLVIFGIKEEFDVVINKRLDKATPKTIIAEKNSASDLFICAYAICFAKSVFLGIKELEKIVFTINAIYKYFEKTILERELSFTEIATLAFIKCKFSKFNDIKIICKIFNVSYKKIRNELLEIFGEVYD